VSDESDYATSYVVVETMAPSTANPTAHTHH
jgi:hypothetical protein